ncbi:response regulator transcription factor [Ferrovibrio sp.]|uniref:response regulator n=1 Tax=Ferrovibrio sp. TaxID=1917215 RepID=UPI000CC7DEC8|nr:response regulator transcription factor [Ferrovibrio sp.]PJI38731.1 MAG: DNA-binding response regulator [Ferrovibrio sp.]
MNRVRTILIVDDEKQIRRFLRTGLSVHGYEVIEAESGAEALREASTKAPDLVVLDLQLGDMDGLDVLQRIREWSWLPVLILSVRNREVEKVKALELGADDYITKPFGIAEFIARVNALLRRIPEAIAQPIFSLGDLSIDLARRQVLLDGTEIKLSPKEYALLQYLARHAGKVVTHEQMLREIWGDGHVEDAHYLRIFMRRLRQKVERDPTQPRYIVTEVGVGYRLRVQDQLETSS